jgi:hypothetical protein
LATAPALSNLKVEDLLKLQYAQQPAMEEFIETLAASWRTYVAAPKTASISDEYSVFFGSIAGVPRNFA